MEAGTASTPSGTGAKTMAGLAAVAGKQYAGRPALRQKVGDECLTLLGSERLGRLMIVLRWPRA